MSAIDYSEKIPNNVNLSEDRALQRALEHWQPGPEELQHLNVGTGVDLTIRELAEAVAAATGYQGEIRWDISKPDGTPKKQLDVSRLAALGWRARIPLAEGLASTVTEFRQSLQRQLLRQA